jgi:hypothetical protein
MSEKFRDLLLSHLCQKEAADPTQENAKENANVRPNTSWVRKSSVCLVSRERVERRDEEPQTTHTHTKKIPCGCTA